MARIILRTQWKRTQWNAIYLISILVRDSCQVFQCLTCLLEPTGGVCQEHICMHRCHSFKEKFVSQPWVLTSAIEPEPIHHLKNNLICSYPCRSGHRWTQRLHSFCIQRILHWASCVANCHECAAKFAAVHMPKEAERQIWWQVHFVFYAWTI